MIKKTICLMMCFFLFFVFVGCNKNEVTAGDIIKVPVELTKNPGMVAASFEIEYDTDAFQFLGKNDGDVLGDVTVNQSKGKISAVLVEKDFSSMKDNTDTGTLFTIKFKVRAGAKPGEYKFKITNYQFININEQEVKAVVNIPQITIK